MVDRHGRERAVIGGQRISSQVPSFTRMCKRSSMESIGREVMEGQRMSSYVSSESPRALPLLKLARIWHRAMARDQNSQTHPD